MRLRIFVEPQQGTDDPTLLRLALTAEGMGFDALFRSDHYLQVGQVSGLPGPSDSWISLAALAVRTTRIRLGTLMTSATFRYPGPLAISVAQVDQMSGGRVELGLGAAWYAAEHAANAIPFPPVAERFARFEEQLAIITGLWQTPEGQVCSFRGDYYTVTDSPALPRPAQRPRPPLLIGGNGPRATPRLAATYADEFNAGFASLADTAVAFGRVRDACAATGRSSRWPIIFSAAQVVCCGRSAPEQRRRAIAIGADQPGLTGSSLAGSPAEVVDKIGQFASLGTETLYLKVSDLNDLDHLELIAAEVLLQV